MTGHYETIELVDYARGYLTGEDAREVFAHCQACTYCGSRLAAVMALREGSRREQARAVRRRRLAMAAGIALVVTLGFAGRGYVFEPQRSIARDLVSAGSSVEDAASNGANVADDDRSDALGGELARLAGLATSSSEILSQNFLLFRFESIPAAAWEDDRELRLGAAAAALWANDLDRAETLLRQLHGESPLHPETSAYYGIALYLGGDRRTEVGELLRRGTMTEEWDVVADYAGWFLANHYLRVGEPGLAAVELTLLSEQSDRVSRAAATLLRQLPERYR